MQMKAECIGSITSNWAGNAPDHMPQRKETESYRRGNSMKLEATFTWIKWKETKGPQPFAQLHENKWGSFELSFGSRWLGYIFLPPSVFQKTSVSDPSFKTMGVTLGCMWKRNSFWLIFLLVSDSHDDRDDISISNILHSSKTHLETMHHFFSCFLLLYCAELPIPRNNGILNL
jgi:hypothetical protein